ncbi:MAG: manganese efflux pump [Bacilli bacterium]|nr:manganese efflux pump [Bacilli bacterium]MDD4282331.1 manganese efflux pump [Bacilli bacterium]MDD4718335.1 manganese efflux pump [Bacilli bacterium]
MPIMTIFLLALSMSMDAFSLSLIYGTINISNKKHLILSLIVGTFHFFMPLLGILLGSSIIDVLHLKIHIVLTIILVFIGIEMILSSKDDHEPLILMNLKGMFLFGIAVSIDSFTLGTGIEAITTNYELVSIIFFLMSAIVTYVGLKIGKKINQNIGKYSTFIGGIVLVIIAILLNFI